MRLRTKVVTPASGTLRSYHCHMALVNGAIRWSKALIMAATKDICGWISNKSNQAHDTGNSNHEKDHYYSAIGTCFVQLRYDDVRGGLICSC